MSDTNRHSIADRDEQLDGQQNALTAVTQGVHLINYDTARRALATAVRVDEVMAIRDQAMALKACAKIAKDNQMELDAAAIRLRAERRLGELMEAQTQTIGKAKGGRPSKKTGSHENPLKPPTLAEAGIDKSLAHRARSSARMSQPEFDQRVDEMRNGDRGQLDIRRAVHRVQRPAKLVKATVVQDDDSDVRRHADQPPDACRASFLAGAEQAVARAHYDGPLEPGWAGEFASAARNVAAEWSALAARFEQATDGAEEPAIAGRGNDEHERG